MNHPIPATDPAPPPFAGRTPGPRRPKLHPGFAAPCALVLLLALAVLGLATTPTAPAGQVVINEFVSSNGSIIADEDGDFEDWIELYNAGAEPVQMLDWGLSDSSDPFRWTFPDITLQPGEFLLVWASGKDRVPEPASPDPDLDPLAPHEVDGLVMWLRPEELADLAAAPGDPLAEWPDASGLGNHASQAVESQRPTFLPNAINAQPAVAFDGSNQQFNLPHQNFEGMDDLANFTFITVARWDGGTTSGIIGTSSASPNTNSGNLHLEIQPGGTLRLRVAAMNGIQVSGALQTGWSVIAASQNDAADDPEARLYLNGSSIGSRGEDSGTSVLADYSGMFLGNSHNSNRHFDGLIAEVIMFNRALSVEELAGVHDYLTIKYDLDNPDGPGSIPPAPHTNFSISADGETLTLTRPDDSTADQVPAVAVPRDTSFGRQPDGTGDFRFFLHPTPLSANATEPFDAPVAEPQFSHQRGFYSDSFMLELSHDDPEADIYFTTDGSPPSPATGTPYTAPIPIDTTTVVRAVADKPGALPVARVATHSYLFLNDVINQPDDPAALGFPTQWGSWQQVHYGMHPDVTQNPAYAPHMLEAMTSIPTLSLVMDMDDLFHPDTGIYSDRTRRGIEWERPVSVELIHPDGEPRGFQVNAGIRAQGGASRMVQRTPKGSLRLLFKNIYESSRLEFPFFESAGTDMDEFNSIVLRAEYNNEWLHPNGLGGGDQRARGQYVRDQFIRNTQIAMSGHGSHSKHVHLYLNGVYWGLYNPSERADAAFAASYFGGEREDWDAITHRGVRDGDGQAWQTLNQLAGADLSVPANYQAVVDYLELDQYIDYMIVNLWAGMDDWPHNNWNAVRRREPGHGFMFFCWDAERSMEDLNRNRVNVSVDAARFYDRMRANPEFRLRFADRVHHHFFNDGVLMAHNTTSRYAAAAAELEVAVIAESARWGSYRRDKHQVTGPFGRLYTRDDFWIPERDRLLNDYLPQRSAIVLNQFRSAGLYPQTAAPEFGQHGGELDQGQPVALSAPQGTIYYTTDGSDPREPGGAVSASAESYAAPFPIDGPLRVTVMARTLHNGEWSALVEADFGLPTFLPDGTADWTSDANWNTDTYPDGAGSGGVFKEPASNDRNINVRSPVTIGRLWFEQASTPFRNRVRDRSSGNSLTFDGDGQPALIVVNGDGEGFVEFEFDNADLVLATDLVLEVNNTLGDPDHGALRLRTNWTGPGGLVKRGPGTASLTGGGKDYFGPTVIEQGVVQITESSAPGNSTLLHVLPGGQLRLISEAPFDDPRIHTFGGPLQIAGEGRSGVDEGAGMGILGAIRYEPREHDSRAIVTNAISLTEPANLHVAHASNTLDLTGPLSGNHTLTKSGGGNLRLVGDQSGFTGPVEIATGTLTVLGGVGGPVTVGDETVLTGHGGSGAIDGSGLFILDRSVWRAPSVTGVDTRLILSASGPPDFTSPDAGPNAALVTQQPPPAMVSIYLDAGSFAQGVAFEGGLVLPAGIADWPALTAGLVAFQPDPDGTHEFNGQLWSPLPEVEFTTRTITADLGDGPQAYDMLRVWPLGATIDPRNQTLAVSKVQNLDLTPLGGEVLVIQGLPPGLRFNRAGQEIFGTPLRPRADGQPYVARALVEYPDGSREWVDLTLDIEPLPSWAPGLYTGYVEVSDPADPEGLFGRGGEITLRVTPTGLYTGQLRLGFRVFGLRGNLQGFEGQTEPDSVLTASLNLRQVFNDPSQDFTLEIELEEGAQGVGLLAGAVVPPGVDPLDGLALTGWQSPWHAFLNPAWGGANGVRVHTIMSAIDAPGAGEDFPGGFSYAVVTLLRSGQAQIQLSLADGVNTAGVSQVGADGMFHLYRPLYRGSGAILLQVQADEVNAVPGLLDGELRWLKRPDARERDYAGGFDLKSPALGRPYVRPPAGEFLFTDDGSEPQDLAWMLGRLGIEDEDVFTDFNDGEFVVVPLEVDALSRPVLAAEVPTVITLPFNPNTGVSGGIFRLNRTWESGRVGAFSVSQRGLYLPPGPDDGRGAGIYGHFLKQEDGFNGPAAERKGGAMVILDGE